jgi:hypothetical protein
MKGHLVNLRVQERTLSKHKQEIVKDKQMNNRTNEQDKQETQNWKQ